jgi:hypothetical protein
MRFKQTRSSDSTFDLNLAPVLDIIVAIVPMLLLSVAFLEVKMIDTPVPQVVEKVIENLEKDPNKVDMTLKISKVSGFTFVVDQNGKVNEVPVVMKEGAYNFDALYREALVLKRTYPQVFTMGVAPDKDVPLSDIIAAMDTLRKTTPEDSLELTDPVDGQKVKTDLMFHKVAFSNILGE